MPSRAAQRRMRGDAVAGQHLLAVMPEQAVAQGELPALAVIFDGHAVHHLRLDLIAAVHAEQRVEHHHSMVPRRVDGSDDGVDDSKVGLGNELQRCIFCAA